MRLERNIAYIPMSLIYLAAVYYFYDVPESPSMFPAIAFSAFYFSLIVGSFKTIIFGRYASEDSINKKFGIKDSVETSIQISIGLILLLIFVGLSLLSSVTVKGDTVFLVVIGFVVALGAHAWQNYMLKFFGINKFHDGIKLSEIGKCLIWYHYLLIFLIVIAIINLFI